MPGEDVADHAERADVERVTALRDGMAQQPRPAHARDQAAAARVDIVRVGERFGMLGRPVLGLLGQRAMALLEEGPVEIAAVGHRPSNTGLPASRCLGS